ncbi:MAG TPA: ATP-binding cassette domain-containing protein [Mogibacterium sp.]|nr:ATP-binding cassette domain-containing protein [Mogibacterium sp.]
MLEFKNVCKDFENPVIENLSFRLAEGERLAVLGESGIGKTTIINLILGITQPDCGEVINTFERISTVFQENRLIEEISALKNLKIVTEKTDPELREILRDLKIENPDEIVMNLSGGMKRRVAIARALIYDADLYLLDEPIQGLDDETRKTVIKKILETTKEKSLILITHSKDDIRDFEIESELKLK